MSLEILSKKLNDLEKDGMSIKRDIETLESRLVVLRSAQLRIEGASIVTKNLMDEISEEIKKEHDTKNSDLNKDEEKQKKLELVKEPAEKTEVADEKTVSDKIES
jgi:hypothetical protein